MRKLFATAVLCAALAGASTGALAVDRCDPDVQAERQQVFTALAARGVVSPG